jgi:multiple sugar transport system substrate-binding protein
MKHSLYKWFLLLALVVPLALTACGQDLEQAVEDAARQVEEAATQVAPQIDEAATRAAEALAEAQEAAEEAMEEAMGEAEEVMEEEPEEMDEPDYDTSVYGHIDEIELDGAFVVFWHQHTGAREEQLQEIVDEFNATNPYGIIVEARNEGGYNDIYNKMIAGLTTGEVPGLTVAYQNQAAAYMVADGLVDLDPYINHPEYGLSDAELSDFFQAFIDGDRLPQFGDKPYGFPPNRSMEMLYYNAEWLAELREAGHISFDGPPQTPEQFAEAVCAGAEHPFSKNPDPSVTIGYQVRTDASNYAALVFARGGDIYDYENNQFTLNTPEAHDGLGQMKELLDQGCAARIAERFGDQTDFGNGQNLFTMGSSSGLPFYRAAVEEGATGGFDWSVAAIPHTTPEPVMNIYGASVSIPKTDPQTQLASWLFIRYYTSPEVQAGWARASNYFPVRASVADGLDEYFEAEPAYEEAFNLLPYSKREAPVAGYDNIRDVMTAAFEEILAGGDIETVLTNAEAEANRILAEAAP